MKVSLDEIHARAGLVASESSLFGLGAGTLTGATLAALLLGHAAAPILRPGLAAGAGLCSCGVVLAWLGRSFDVGGTARRPEGLPRIWWPMMVLGAVLAISGWVTLALVVQHEPSATTAVDPVWPWGKSAAIATVGSLLCTVPLLATLGLRGLLAVDAGAPMPLAQLFQAASHNLLGGLGLLMVMGYASEAMGVELKFALGAAICTTAAHAILWSSWLLRGSRRAIARLRAQGIRVPMLDRGHSLASAAVVLGLLAPGLTVLAGLVTGRDTGLTVACAVLAVSNHTMRYGLVLLPLGHVVKGPPSPANEA